MSVSPATDPPRANLDIPGHSLIRLLGEGLDTRTWLATQRSMQRAVAVKVFTLADEAARQRFEASLRAASHLGHPDIAPIHSVGRTASGELFYSMPYLPRDVREQPGLLRKSLRVASLLRNLLDALDHAHGRGIVHGAVRPSNLRSDGHGNVQICDFGLALPAHGLGMPLSTTAATWISPEQARGEAPDARSDLYALAVVAWELLTGSPPFSGGDALAIAMAHAQQPVPRLPAMLSAWQAWMDRALAKSPAARFQSAREMASALAGIDGRGEAGSPAVSPTHLPRQRWLLGAGALVAVVVVALGAWMLLQPHPAKAPTAAAAVAIAPAPASRPAAAPPAAATVVANPAQALIEQGDRLRAQGHVFAPAGQNAVTAYLAALKLDPGNATASANIGALLDAQRKQLEVAWRADAPDRALVVLKRGEALAHHAHGAARSAWRDQRVRLARAVGSAIVAAADGRVPERVKQLAPLATALPAVFPADFDLGVAERRATALRAGDTVRDPSGPALVYVPAGGGTPAFAVARVEATRADYATFVHATHRAASACREPHNPFSRLRKLTWQAPGFQQSAQDPAVCVSWNDAAAYAAWLSRRTGEPYRLPDMAEWQRAAQGTPKGNACQLGNVDDASRHARFDNDRQPCNDGAAYTAPVGHYAASAVGAYDMYGNVAEWLAGGSRGARGSRGLSWRAGSHQSAFGSSGDADSDTGYDNIGFRVLRVIDAAHPAPPRIVGH